MKNSNNNHNWNQTLRTLTFIALVMLIAVVKLSAAESNVDTLKAKKEVSKEEAVMIEDLLKSLEDTDEFFAESVPTVEVYNARDELVFTGTQQSWETQKAAEIASLKIKAELLFELEGTSVYKIF